MGEKEGHIEMGTKWVVEVVGVEKRWQKHTNFMTQ